MTVRDDVAPEARRKLVERIRALLAKTAENGCTESEAMAAAAKAAELMRQYDLSMSDLDVERARSEGCKEGPTEERDLARHFDVLATAAAAFADAAMWREPSGRRRPGEPEKGRYVFFGCPSDVEIAGYVFAICVRALETESEAHRRTVALMRAQVRERMARSFCDGMAASMARKLHEIREARRSASGGRDLVPLKSALVKDAVDALGHDFHTGRIGYRDVDEGSYRSGVEAGKRVRFDPGIAGGGAGAALESDRC